MTPTRSGNANAMLVVIMLVVITIAFAFLAWTSAQRVEEIQDGSLSGPLKISPSNSLKRLHAETEEMEQQRDELLRQRADLVGRLRSIELDLAGHGIYRRGGEWIGGDNLDTKWTATRQTVQADHDILQLWDRHYQDSNEKFERLRRVIREGEDYKEGVQRQIADEEDAFNVKRDRLISEQDRLQDAREALTREHRVRFAELSIKQNKLERQIRDLLELELEWLEHIEADGRVLELVGGEQHVIINLGSMEQLKPGMRFEIFAWEKGKHITKGLCEVTDVGGTVSTCRVLENYTDALHPIVSGDAIGNPVFDTDRTNTFVLAGEFASYNRADLARFIERLGGKVREELGPSVDYLVAGARSEAAQDQAREYRVVAMTEDQLVRFLDTSFRP